MNTVLNFGIKIPCVAGSSDLPDAANDVDWIRPGVNMSEEDQKRFYKKEITR